MRGRMEIGRAARLVEDVIRTYPEGASRDVLVSRLGRVGVNEDDAVVLLDALERRQRIIFDGKRFVLSSN